MTERAPASTDHHVDPDDLQRRTTKLADLLDTAGALTTEPWREAVLATPRHVFVPHFFDLDAVTGHSRLIDGGDPRWLDLVYSDEPLVTQFNEDPDATSGIPTSSSTAPSLMVRMLEALDVHDGHTVLEIGTGTGYNAALLSHRLGASNVTTVDVDETLTSLARERLAHLGLHPAVVTVDGAAGYPDNAPYDRLIATCSLRHVPPAWLDQLAPGGVILVTLETSLHGYALARLVVDDHHHAAGEILNQPASFMPMRSQADPAYATLKAGAAPDGGAARHSRVTRADLDSDDARFIIGLALPSVASFTIGAGGLYLAHHTNHSWAELDDNGTVTHGGEADLWATLETAYANWTAAERPARHDLALTVTPARQTLTGGGLTLHLPARD